MPSVESTNEKALEELQIAIYKPIIPYGFFKRTPKDADVPESKRVRVNGDYSGPLAMVSSPIPSGDDGVTEQYQYQQVVDSEAFESPMLSEGYDSLGAIVSDDIQPSIPISIEPDLSMSDSHQNAIVLDAIEVANTLNHSPLGPESIFRPLGKQKLPLAEPVLDLPLEHGKPLLRSQAVLNASMPGKRGRSSTRKSVSGDMLGYMNPFADTDPRIPDGSVSESLTKTHRNTQMIQLLANSTYHILMYPGFSSGYFVLKGTVGSLDLQGVGSIWDVNEYKPKTQDILDSTPRVLSFTSGTGEAIAANHSSDVDFQHNCDVAQWRLVSQGIRLSLLADDDKNDGYFESCRLKADRSHENFMLVDRKDSPCTPTYGTGVLNITINDALLTPRPSIIKSVNTTDIAENDGYSAAPLKMIGAAMWQLKPLDDDHSWITFQDGYNVDAGTMESLKRSVGYQQAATYTTNYTTTPSVNHPSVHAPAQRPDEGWNRMTKEFVDPNHDMVYIRVFTGANTKQLLIQHKANHEVVYKTGSTLSEFHKDTKKQKGVENWADMKS